MADRGGAASGRVRVRSDRARQRSARGGPVRRGVRGHVAARRSHGGGSDARLVAGMGEPLRVTFTPDEIHRLAAEAGLEVVEEPSVADLTARYLAGRRDGMLPILIERLLWLRV